MVLVVCLFCVSVTAFVAWLVYVCLSECSGTWWFGLLFGCCFGVLNCCEWVRCLGMRLVVDGFWILDSLRL